MRDFKFINFGRVPRYIMLLEQLARFTPDDPNVDNAKSEKKQYGTLPEVCDYYRGTTSELD